MPHIIPAAMHLAIVTTNHPHKFYDSLEEALAGVPGREVPHIPDGLNFVQGGDVFFNQVHIGYYVTYEDVIRWVDKVNGY